MDKLISYPSYNPTNLYQHIKFSYDNEPYDVDGTLFYYDPNGDLRCIYSPCSDEEKTDYLLVILYRKEVEYISSGTLFQNQEFSESIYSFKDGSLVGYLERSNEIPFDLEKQEDEDVELLQTHMDYLLEELWVLPKCDFTFDPMSFQLYFEVEEFEVDV